MSDKGVQILAAAINPMLTMQLRVLRDEMINPQFNIINAQLKLIMAQFEAINEKLECMALKIEQIETSIRSISTCGYAGRHQIRMNDPGPPVNMFVPQIDTDCD